MSFLIGEYDCKLDAKGRMMIPADLKRQLPGVETEGLVILRGFEKQLTIYTKVEWENTVNELNKLNQYDKINRDFLRFFIRGAMSISVDSVGRTLLPKALLDYAGIKGEVILSCQLNKIEVWEPGAYDTLMNSMPDNFAEMAEQVMGSAGRRGNE
ncbi:division/cell wall cluster transcriptional repressor MraZ [Mucilaginibacter limnophilus]|uniref:Transcriptional regulator MraZ n=1 Tax=Mucilaginibacter limnophilus TaxID=1932778 RepID=A0A437MR52_9SPHI|nr:division/cell wall cluster transcriptional repressor MraZ [Mucilaginibacter limnophilus]RVU00093.1 division/cell wall cluster transcriptional repressor MraZ [Mucilaginibacter limnophilus]